MAQLWACPPEKHQDYIFYRHPPEQNMPDLKRLQAWYRALLEKGRTEGIITEYKDMDSFVKKEKIKCASDLPYFDGDYWPSEMETCIRDVSAEESVPITKGRGKYGGKPNSKKVMRKQNLFQRVKAAVRKYKNDDYDLCIKCYSPEKHEHAMERKWTYTLGADKQTIAVCKENGPTVLKQLENHTWSCQDKNCEDECCQVYKIHIDHVIKRKQGNCKGCKELLLFMMYHVRFCKKSLACFPFCRNVKKKLYRLTTALCTSSINNTNSKEQGAYKGA